MTTKKALFIINPRSGKGQIKNYLLDITDIFIKGGMSVTLYITQGVMDACKVVRESAHNYDVVICSGGDGTLDEVATGMMECTEKRPIGYIPAGSTNDFANSLMLPKDMKDAAQCIVDDQPYLCDIGSFNGDYFVYIAAFGMFTDVSYQTNQDLKNVLGHLAYVLEGAKRLFNIKSYHMKVTLDEEEVIEDDFIYGMVTNSQSVGGFKNITGSHVQLDDGLFEVTLIRNPKNPIELQEIIGSLMIREMDSHYIITRKAAGITFETDSYVPWTLDGEFGGEHEQVEIVNHNRAIPILVSQLPQDL